MVCEPREIIRKSRLTHNLSLFPTKPRSYMLRAMLNATLVKRIEVTKDLIIIGVKPDAGIPDFQPGQYVALALVGSAPRPDYFPPEKEVYAPDKLIKRAYSIGSSPVDKSALEFYLAILPEGALTSRLVSLKVGDRLYCAPKITGTFTCGHVAADHNLFLVATGTGLAPYIAMVRTPAIWTAGRRISIIHGVRFPSDLAYADELTSLANTNPNFSYHQIVSRQSPEWTGQRGYVQRLFKENIIKLDSTADHVFICGNPAMVKDMEEVLLPLGYSEHSKKNPAGQLHVEKYW